MYIAESWGVFEGLQLAIGLGFYNIDICVDFQQVVHDIKTSNTSNIMGKNLIRKIRSYFQPDKDIHVIHIFHEANLCVDALAKQEIHHSKDIFFFDSYPTYIEHLLKGDLPDIPVSRLISM